MPINNRINEVAVLFVLIGWADRYDGTESIIGGHGHLQNNPNNNSEMKAFVCNNDGYYYCGAGDGEINEKSLDVIFVARNIDSDIYQVIGIYSNVEVIEDNYRTWKKVRTKEARLIPPEDRPTLPSWPKGQGMRRWARRVFKKGREHETLLAVYEKLAALTPEQLEFNAFEGKQRKLIILHRQREARLRETKIRQVLKQNDGKLRCEVPGCGFDFQDVYGEIGIRFAVVHHLIPLSSVTSSGTQTSIDDLAVVCANCHAMIHRGGECRSLETLIPKRKDWR